MVGQDDLSFFCVFLYVYPFLYASSLSVSPLSVSVILSLLSSLLVLLFKYSTSVVLSPPNAVTP